MITTQRLPYVVRKLLRKPLFSCYTKRQTIIFTQQQKPIETKPSIISNDTEKHNSSLKHPINCHGAVTAEKTLSWGALSHWPELLPCSCIRHLPAERLFANTARDKHVSHGENRRGKKQQNKHKNMGRYYKILQISEIISGNNPPPGTHKNHALFRDSSEDS